MIEGRALIGYAVEGFGVFVYVFNGILLRRGWAGLIGLSLAVAGVIVAQQPTWWFDAWHVFCRWWGGA